MTYEAPVIKDGLSEHRKPTSSPISWIVAIRPIGCVKGIGKEVAIGGITINAFVSALIRTPFNAGTNSKGSSW